MFHSIITEDKSKRSIAFLKQIARTKKEDWFSKQLLLSSLETKKTTNYQSIIPKIQRNVWKEILNDFFTNQKNQNCSISSLKVDWKRQVFCSHWEIFSQQEVLLQTSWFTQGSSNPKRTSVRVGYRNHIKKRRANKAAIKKYLVFFFIEYQT